MKGNKIIVVGSTNMDMVVKTDHIPEPGETVLGGNFFMNPGGKGANQAVAIARLGGDVMFISKIGDDIFGKQSSQMFDEEGIDTRGLVPDENSPSGVALITVDEEGENSIVVAPGANANLMPCDLEETLDKIEDVSILLMQLEIPLQTVKKAAQIASGNDMKVILNPAPVPGNVDGVIELFPFIDIITPNVKEAEMLSGIPVKDEKSAKRAGKVIYEQGVNNVVITMGRMGALVLESGECTYIPATEVETIDTTAAGDSFNGALAVGLSEGKSLVDSVRFACRAAAITVTRMGAQSAMPYRNELVLSILE
ncbi:ribokinase [Membranihabitans maritimus]|uniref:ribokinase n=1 Tax=Membranihabitans maritimus TaxID=2904244 RepID=UPI001F00D853|nr:ribokinase [Membranihabitans maritimus]